MGGRVNILLTVLVLLALSVWGVAEILTLREERLQWAILGVAAIGIALIVIKKELPIDVKLLIFAFLGYFVGAKGFAYLSPVAPLYIGEIVLGACCLGYVYRYNVDLVKPLRQHVLITLCFLFLILATIHAYFDFRVYKLYAIRDFAMIYYSLFMIVTYFLMRVAGNREVFEKFFVPGLLIGGATALIAGLGGREMLESLSFGLISPHADVGGPLFTALAVYFIHRYSTCKKLKWLALGGLATVFLFTQKSAYPFCFVLTCGYLMIFARMRIMLALGVFAALAVAVVLPLDILFKWDILTGSDIAETVSVTGESSFDAEADVQSSTVQWRFTWWKIVYEQTMEESPWWGCGFGADITTPFLREMYNIDFYGQEHGYARYPHNFFFTVLGRLGWLGVACLMVYVVAFTHTMIGMARELRLRHVDAREVAMVAFVFAGFCNAFVQATYEAPFAAIIHWIVLGYLIAVQRKNAIERRNIEC